MIYRMWTLIIKELTQLLRAPIIIILVTMGPLSEMSMVAWSTAAPIENLPTAVVDLDRTDASRQLLAKLATTKTFDFQFFLDDVNAITPLIEYGDAVGALVIPRGYERNLKTSIGDSAQVSFVLDGADPIAARAALASVQGTVETESGRVLAQWVGEDASAALSLIQPVLRVRFNEDLKKSIYTVPSELGLILFAIALLLASIAIARERELGTLEQLMVTPMGRFELIVAKAVPPVLLSYISFILMLLVAMYGFGVPMRGSWGLLLGSATIFLFVELSIGLMISAWSSNQIQGMLGAMMWVMTEFFFSGYGVPVENMPDALQKLAHIFPIYHWMIIFRAILLKGVGFDVILPQLLWGLGIGLVVIPLGMWILGRQKWD